MENNITEVLLEVVNKIDYSNINLEIAWQIELIILLRKELGSDYNIIPEYSIEKKNLKKEIDIVIITPEGKKYAIELKMPLKGAALRRMSQAIVDIAFLERLKNNGFDEGFFLMTTNDCRFWEGKVKTEGVYEYFRNNKKLGGKIKLPDFFKEVKEISENRNVIELEGHYELNWLEIEGNEKNKKFTKFLFVEV